MKLLSFKKVVSFIDNDQIVVEDLALNHPYKKIKNKLVVKGYDEQTKWKYTVYFTLRGELEKVCLERHSRSIALLPWKQENDIYELQKIKANGDIFSVVTKFITTSRVEKQLVSKVFCLEINGEKQEKQFIFSDNNMISRGCITREQRLCWFQ